MKKLLLSIPMFAALLFGGAVHAQESAVRQALQERLGKDFRVDSVLPSPIKGMYEVRVGAEIFYVDEKAEHLIAGNIQNLKTGANITQDRLDKLANQVVFNPDNLKNALKLVRGNGKRQMAVFEDPNCGYCKKLRTEMEKMDNVTIYTYLIPILGGDGANKITNIWCANNKNKTYDDWMMRGATPATADSRCAAPINASQSIAESLRIRGTPAIFVDNGKRIPGYVEVAQLEKTLNDAQR